MKNVVVLSRRSVLASTGALVFSFRREASPAARAPITSAPIKTATGRRATQPW